MTTSPPSVTEISDDGSWRERYESEFGVQPTRPRAKITDEVHQDNVNDYTWEERFRYENGRSPTPKEIRDVDDLTHRIFGIHVVRGYRDSFNRPDKFALIKDPNWRKVADALAEVIIRGDEVGAREALDAYKNAYASVPLTPIEEETA